PAHAHGQKRDRRNHDQCPRHRLVALCDPLLDEVTEHHEQDHVKRLQRAQLTPTGDAGNKKDEEEDNGGSNYQVHGYGKMVRERWIVVMGTGPSSSSMSSRRL